MPNTHSLSAEHRRHDRLLVARFAVGDAAFGQEHEAQELVRRCSECAALAADITAISKSVAQMPAPPRTRDFRLTQDQAANLRGSRLDRWLRAITGSGWSTVRPVAAVALSVGMVMSVVGFLPVIGAASGPTGTDRLEVAAGQPTPASIETDAGNEFPAPPEATGSSADLGAGGKVNVQGSPASDSIDNAYLSQQTAPSEAGGRSNEFGSAALPGAGPNVRDIVLLSGIAVTVGALLILALLYMARRRYYDPLLR